MSLVTCVTVLVLLLVAGCGSAQVDRSVPDSSGGSSGRISLGARPLVKPRAGSISAHTVVAALGLRGYPVRNLLDVTDQICPTAGCDQAVVTDALRAMSFSSQAAATRYAREHGLRHWRNVVITFPPEMAAGEQDSYWLAIVEIFR